MSNLDRRWWQIFKMFIYYSHQHRVLGMGQCKNKYIHQMSSNPINQKKEYNEIFTF